MKATMPAQPIKLYRAELSGHCHRVELFLTLLGLPFTLIDVDMQNGAHKEPTFLSINPFGQVPVIEDGDVILYDSNAILVYLAIKYDSENWFPSDAISAARIQQWLSLAAGPIAYGPATARLVTLFDAPFDHENAKIVARRLLVVIETDLMHSSFAIGEAPTIADIACYSYIAKAPEGGISLEAYPRVKAWLSRIEELPGFVPMKSSISG